ncbi:MAG TPA: histidine phosphatase family protein, partial [Solirubrobacter sp.]|nr:histidine phosphatase family protein [Solirubrobacter sp.]
RQMETEPADADRLSDRGWEQARGLGERLRGQGIDAIVASPFGRAQETAQGIGEVLGLPFDTDEDLYEVRQSDAYRAASPHYVGTGHVSWMPDAPPDYAEPGAESFAQIVARVRRVQERLEQRLFDERILCVSHWGFLHFFLGAAIFREAFAPAHLPALYRISHVNTGITIFHHRRDYLIEGVRFDGWALQTWNDQAHL